MRHTLYCHTVYTHVTTSCLYEQKDCGWNVRESFTLKMSKRGPVQKEINELNWQHSVGVDTREHSILNSTQCAQYDQVLQIGLSQIAILVLLMFNGNWILMIEWIN